MTTEISKKAGKLRHDFCGQVQTIRTEKVNQNMREMPFVCPLALDQEFHHCQWAYGSPFLMQKNVRETSEFLIL